MLGTMYIVKLEKGVWLAPWDGDPGRTLKKENAKEFKLKSDANHALIQARMYRPFNDAEICILS
jgi:hypothetical protein